jgi:hypothetical protein
MQGLDSLYIYFCRLERVLKSADSFDLPKGNNVVGLCWIIFKVFLSCVKHDDVIWSSFDMRLRISAIVKQAEWNFTVFSLFARIP